MDFALLPSTALVQIDSTSKRMPNAAFGLQAVLELRCIALHPAHDGRMRDRQAALRHHLHQVPQTELEPQVPAHTMMTSRSKCRPSNGL